ncbi:hypothetical protein ScPMuIL_012681 [Solemya velum]
MITKFLIIIVFCSFVESHVEIHLPGDAIVGGLFPFHKSVNGECSDELDYAVVQEAEAVKWIFNKLNQGNFINGVKLGFKAYATCGKSDLAQKWAEQIVFENYHMSLNCSDEARYVGLIGPESSSEATVVGKLLGSMGPSNRLLQIGYSTTALSLSDKSRYPHFFRVVPPDKWQIQAMVDLMLKLNWTYVAVLYEDDIYGNEASNELIASAKASGICVNKAISVNNNLRTDEIVDFFSHSLGNLSDQDGNRIGGLVFFGGSQLARLLALSTNNLTSRQTLPVFIFSEGVNGQNELFKFGNWTPIPATKGSYTLNPFSVELTEFTEHWQSMLKKESTLLAESKANSWLLDLFEEQTGCRPDIGTCSFLNDEEIYHKFPLVFYSQYAVEAALAIAWTIKHVLSDACPSGGICPRFCDVPVSDFITRLSGSNINLGMDFHPFYVKSFRENKMTLAFDRNNDVQLSENIPAYEVQIFKACADVIIDFCFVKVGNYKNNGLQFDEVIARDYASNGSELIWPNFRKAQCEDFSKCMDCTVDDRVSGIYHIPGDMYVIGIVPIHDIGVTSLQCGPIRPTGGFEISEAIVYAIKRTKKLNMPIPNADIGVLIIDTCNDKMLIQQRILSLHRFGLPLDTGEHMFINNRVIGYIGALGSGISIPAAETTTRLGYVQVSYGSTSPVLSDRNKFPYFMRLPSPDDKQAPVILSIVQRLKSNLIQLVYSEGAYGEGGRDSIVAAAPNFRVCIANIIPVAEIVGARVDSYSYILDGLREHSDVRYVVFFLRSHVQPRVLEMLNQKVNPGEFLFIGSEAWGIRDNLQYVSNLEGSLTIAQRIPVPDAFREYMGRLHPNGSDSNAWLQPYMESRLDCYYQWSFDKLSGKKCNENNRLDAGTNYKMDTWTPFALHATQALLMGAQQALVQLCGNSSTVCDAYRTNPDVLVQNIKETKLDLTNIQIPAIVFDENGDGLIDYIVYNVQKKYGIPTYTEVGSWLAGGGFQFWEDKLIHPGGAAFQSVCSGQAECDRCFPPVNDDNTLVGFIAALAVLAVALVVTVVLLVVMIIWFRRQDKAVSSTAMTIPASGETDVQVSESRYQGLHSRQEQNEDGSMSIKSKEGGQSFTDSDDLDISGGYIHPEYKYKSNNIMNSSQNNEIPHPKKYDNTDFK